jgi:hypothetical protein
MEGKHRSQAKLYPMGHNRPLFHPQRWPPSWIRIRQRMRGGRPMSPSSSTPAPVGPVSSASALGGPTSCVSALGVQRPPSRLWWSRRPQSRLWRVLYPRGRPSCRVLERAAIRGSIAWLRSWAARRQVVVGEQERFDAKCEHSAQIQAEFKTY